MDDDDKPAEGNEAAKVAEAAALIEAAKATATAAEERANTLAAELQALKDAAEEQKRAGLPEAEQIKARLDEAERKAKEAEERAAKAEDNVLRSTKAQWVRDAAEKAKVVDAALVAGLVNLDNVTDEASAARAVKEALKGRESFLVKKDDPVLPGQVLKGGQAASPAAVRETQLDRDAQVVSDGLKEFLASRRR